MHSPPEIATSAGTKSVLFVDENAKGLNDGVPGSSSVASETLVNKKAKGFKFLSQPIPRGSISAEAANVKKLKDKRFDSFKTWSGKLERKISNLQGKSRQSESEEDSVRNSKNEALAVDRYFDALGGPELETLRASDEIVLLDDKAWPFLLRYLVSSFGICLGVSSQSVMQKTLATASSTKFLHINLIINLILWRTSVALLAIISFVYLQKAFLYFEAVRREY